MLQLKQYLANLASWIVYFWQKFKMIFPSQNKNLLYIILGVILLVVVAVVVIIILSKRKSEEQPESAASDAQKQAIVTEPGETAEEKLKSEGAEVFSVQERGQDKKEGIEEAAPAEEKILKAKELEEPIAKAEEVEELKPVVEKGKVAPERVIEKTIRDEKAVKAKDIIKDKFIHQVKADLEAEFIGIIKRYTPEKISFKEKIPMDEDDINRCNDILEKLEPLAQDKNFKFSKDYFQTRTIFYFASAQDDLFEKSLKKEMDLYPDDETILIQAASYYLYNDSIALAEQFLDKAKQINSSNFDIYFLMGEMYFKKNNFYESLNMFKKVVLLAPKNPLAYAYKGYILAQKGFISDGEHDLKKAIKLNYQEPISYYFLGNIYKKLKFYSKAIDNYKKALKYGCKLIEFKENFAFCLLKTKKFDMIMELLQPLNDKKCLSKNGKQILSEAYMYAQDYKKAIDLLIKAYDEIKNKKDETATDLELKIANIYFYNLKDYKKAESYYSLVSEKNKNNYQVNQNLEYVNYHKSKIKLHNNLGVIHAQGGNYQDAIAEFKKALEIDPGNKESLHNIEKASKLLTDKKTEDYQEKKVV